MNGILYHVHCIFIYINMYGKSFYEQIKKRKIMFKAW